MNIRDIEESIINKLKEEFKDLLVQGFPEKPSEFIMIHPIAAILVHYQNSSYTNTYSLGCITQDNKKEFSITVITRNLRSNNGAYELIDRIKRLLTGFSPDCCSKMMPVKDYFISENTGIWQYGIDFSLNTTNIQIL